MKQATTDSANQWAQRLAIAGGIALVIFALYAAQTVLVPMALALLLCFLLTPLCNRLEYWGLPRVVAVVLMMAVVVVIIGSLLYMTYGGVARIIEHRVEYRDAIVTKVQAFGGGESFLNEIEEAKEVFEEAGAAIAGEEPSTKPTTKPSPTTRKTTSDPGLLALGGIVDEVEQVSEEVEQVQETVSELGTRDNPVVTRALPPTAGVADQVSGLLGFISEPIGTFGLTAVFALFILLERDRLRDKVLRLTSGGKLNIATQAIEEAGTRISKYLVAQAIVNGSYGLVVAIGLNVISYLLTGHLFPSWPLWAVLCAALRFVPYIGPWIGAILPLLVTLGEYDGFNVFFWVVGMFVVVELWSNNLMEPWLYGSSTGISPVGILAAAAFWTWLWGVEGLILSTPLTVCLFVLGKYVPPLKFLDILLREEDVLPPSTRLYQRLLAMDEEESYDIVETFLEKQSVESLFDEVVMPALAMAERDRHSGVLPQQRQAFIHETLRELIATVSEKSIDCAGAENVPLPPTVPAGEGTRVAPHAIILPARDEADELAGQMLARVMTTCGYRVTVLGDETLVTEMEDVVRRESPAAVVLSAVPPAALAHARYVTKKLADDLGDARLIVALWTSRADREASKKRLPETRGLTVTRSVKETIEAVRQASAGKV